MGIKVQVTKAQLKTSIEFKFSLYKKEHKSKTLLTRLAYMSNYEIKARYGWKYTRSIIIKLITEIKNEQGI